MKNINEMYLEENFYAMSSEETDSDFEEDYNEEDDYDKEAILDMMFDREDSDFNDDDDGIGSFLG